MSHYREDIDAGFKASFPLRPCMVASRIEPDPNQPEGTHA